MTDEQLAQVKGNFNVLEDNAGVTFTQFGPEAPQYCLENTFDTDNQAEYATTRVIFKAKYVPENADENGTFYQLGTTASIYNTETLKEKVLESMSDAERRELGIFDEYNAAEVTLPTAEEGKAGGKYTMAEGGKITYTKYERRKTGTDEWEVVTKKLMMMQQMTVTERRQKTRRSIINIWNLSTDVWAPSSTSRPVKATTRR